MHDILSISNFPFSSLYIFFAPLLLLCSLCVKIIKDNGVINLYYPSLPSLCLCVEFYLGVQRRSSRALLTTVNELRAMAAAAMTGLSSPSAARGMPRML